MTAPHKWRQVHGRGVWIAPTASVGGRVSIGDETSVWYSAVIRGDGDFITIGDRCNIQDGAVVHSDPGSPVQIGDGVSVGHNAVVHGCTVESDVLIGMSSVLMNGVVVGAGSIVAAGALLPEGTVIPPGSLVVGAPGRVRRQVRPHERDSIERNAADYVRLMNDHRASSSAVMATARADDDG